MNIIRGIYGWIKHLFIPEPIKEHDDTREISKAHGYDLRQVNYFLKYEHKRRKKKHA